MITTRMNTGKLIDSFVTKLTAAGVPVRRAENSQLFLRLEQKMPRRLPPSLTYLLTRYIFPTFDFSKVTLFGWDLKTEESEFFGAASASRGSLSELLLPAGYFQIGRPDTGSFDAVCLDLNGKAENREYRIVLADHEQILCNNRVRITAELCRLSGSSRRRLSQALIPRFTTKTPRSKRRDSASSFEPIVTDPRDPQHARPCNKSQTLSSSANSMRMWGILRFIQFFENSTTHDATTSLVRAANPLLPNILRINRLDSIFCRDFARKI